MVSTCRGAVGVTVGVTGGAIAGGVALTLGVDVAGTGAARRDAADDPSAEES